MIIYEVESSRSIENFLRSRSLIEILKDEFGKDYENSDDEEIIDFIRNYTESETEVLPDKAMVTVLHCDGDAIDIVDTNHQVIRFNGKYFDYTAKRYNNSFDEKILDGNIPVVQPIIKTEDQVRPTISTVKYYVMLGETK